MQNIFHGYLTGVGIEIIKLDLKEKRFQMWRSDILSFSAFSFWNDDVN